MPVIHRWSKKRPSSTFITPLAILAFVIIAGSIGYSAVEGLSLFESFYQTMIIISTLGIRQVKDMSRGGDIVTLFLIIGGVGAFAYAFSAMATFLVEGQLRKVLGRRKVDTKIAKLKGHYIICGYGQMGELIAKSLRRQGLPIIVVDRDSEVTTQAEADGLLYVHGNAHEESILTSARIDRAKALVSVLGTDADNVFVTLTARELSDDIPILTKAMDPDSEPKLKKAGATRICNPNAIGANRITAILTHPTLVEFIDGVAEGVDIEVQELDIAGGSKLAGKALKDSGVREKTGVMVIAIKRKDGKTVFSPAPETTITEGDTLVCVGEKGSAERLESYAGV
ncbi:potassium channel family protein [Acidobacteriota bacterium]